MTSVLEGHATDFTPETQAVVLLWAVNSCLPSDVIIC